MLQKITFLKQERLPLALGGLSWFGLTGLLFEMNHMVWLLALSLSFFPSLFILFAARLLFSKTKKIETKPTELQGLEKQETPAPVEVSNPNLERFLADFSHILEMQRQYWESKTNVEKRSVEVPVSESVPFSVALQDYGRQERAFVLWQNYKESVLGVLRIGMRAWVERDREISVESLNYKLSERELYLFCPQEQVRDALEEVKFFLHAVKRREKELEDIIAYLDKVAADGIWLSNERRQKMKEYQKSKEICQKQLELDTEEILRNLEEIFTAL